MRAAAETYAPQETPPDSFTPEARPTPNLAMMNDVVTPADEIARARILATSKAAYEPGASAAFLGLTVPLSLSFYNCTEAMSAVTGKPYLTTAQLSNDSATRSADYTEIPAEQFSQGDWIVVRYSFKDSTEVLGHVQMNMGGGQYFDSAYRIGPRISGNPVTAYLEGQGATMISKTYLRPRG